MNALTVIEKHLKLGEKMRQKQRELLRVSTTKDLAAKHLLIKQVKALERLFDTSTKQMFQLVEQDFQPELFR